MYTENSIRGSSYLQILEFFFIRTAFLFLLCPALHAGQTPWHFILQNKQRQGGRVICWQKKQASFRQKTCGIKWHFIPLSRVPLSLQPPHFVAVAGYAALPIGARLYLYSLTTKKAYFLILQATPKSFTRREKTIFWTA